MGTTRLTAEDLVGRDLVDETGRSIGPIADVYVDDDGWPHWVLVDTGFFKGFLSVIPVTDVKVTDKGLTVHYSMEKLTGAPNCMVGKLYAKHREGLLYDYYRLNAPSHVEMAANHADGEGVLSPPSDLCLLSTKGCEITELEFETD
jgi:hypothetical protein